MRRSNQFDPDLYGDPPRKKIGGCSPFMLMLMLGLCVFFFVQTQGALNARKRPPANRPKRVEKSPTDRPRAIPSQGSRRADDGDWSIEEVDTTDGSHQAESAVRSDGLLNENLPEAGDRRADPQNTEAQRGGETSNAQRTDRGDWSIEEVESGKPSPSKPKSTEKGDWSIEEVAE